MESEINNRLRAQNGMFIWWQPPEEQMKSNKFPILIRASGKVNILREIAHLGFRPELLFPDEEGSDYQKSFDKFLKI